MDILDLEEIEYCSELSNTYFKVYSLKDTQYIFVVDMCDSYSAWTTRRNLSNIKGVFSWFRDKQWETPGQKVFDTSPKHIQEKLIFVLDQLI